jgi:predicted PurR-regulated permease PerM
MLQFGSGRIEGQGAVLPDRPVPGGRAGSGDPGGTMARMPGGVTKTQIPRWIQLVGLPVLVLLAWAVAGAVRHVVFIFLVAVLVALLLNPLVRAVSRLWIPRGLAVALVFLTFAAVAIVLAVAVIAAVVDRTRSASNRVDEYFTIDRGQPPRTDAERDIDRFQVWLDDHRLGRVKIRKQGQDFVDNIKAKDVEKYSSRVIDFVEGAAIGTIKLLFSIILVIVISVYMLLDMPRLAARIDRRFPPHAGSEPLLTRMEHALASYVKGQVLLSLIMGASAGVGLWVLGTVGLVPNADKYAVLFGSWVAVTELIPYLGPWLGAIPPFLYALAVHPVSAIWVVLLFLGIHQVEGHIVVPNVMGSALRLHPLLVIFGLLAGAEIYGLPGVLVALPLLAVGRATWEFFSERIALEPWAAGAMPVEDVGVFEPGPLPAEALPADAAPVVEPDAADTVVAPPEPPAPVSP